MASMNYFLNTALCGEMCNSRVEKNNFFLIKSSYILLITENIKLCCCFSVPGSSLYYVMPSDYDTLLIWINHISSDIMIFILFFCSNNGTSREPLRLSNYYQLTTKDLKIHIFFVSKLFNENHISSDIMIFILFFCWHSCTSKYFREFPGLLSGCAIDWMCDWPQESLLGEASYFITRFQLIEEFENLR
jgi:hypothetical protein